MQRRPAIERGAGDAGLTSAEYAIGLLLFSAIVLFALNLAFIQYVRGAARSAAAEGAQVGALADRSAAECQRVGIDALGNLLGDEVADRVGFRCVEVDDTMVAIASGSVAPWIGFMPEVPVEARVVVHREPEP